MRLAGRFGLCFAAFVSLLGGCGGKGGLLVATITSTSSLTTSTVMLDVTANGTTKRYDVPVQTGTIPPGVEVGIQFPPDKIGTVTLVATVGSLTATGEATLAEGETERITLTLGAAMPDLSGDGPSVDLAVADLPSVDTPAVDLAGADFSGSDLTSIPDLVVPTAALTALPTSIGFEKIAQGARSAGVKVTITNGGNGSTAALAVSIAAPFQKENDLCTGQILAPAGQCTLDLYFSPTALGAAATNVSVTDGIASASIALSGEGVQASQMQATPPSGSAAWSGIIVSQSGPKVTFSVKNTGGVPTSSLTVTKTSSVPTDKDNFVKGADSCQGQMLAASGASGDTCTIEVTYTPTTKGSHLAALEVQESGGGLLTISLSGSALSPPTISITPVTTSDFGAVPTGKNAKRTFTIGNSGDVAADNANMTYSFTPAAGPYTISSNGCGSGVPASGSCTLEVTFSPSAVGTAPATSLKARYMGATIPASEDSEPLSGAGINPAALAFSTSGPANFPDTQTGMSSQKTFTLTNTGDEVASNIVVSEGSASFSILTNNCDEGVTLAKDQTCTVVVVFAPSAAGTVTSNLTGVATEGTATPFPLSGTGFVCTDADADGRFTDVRCGGVADCNDADTDNWDKCGTCVDTDGDGYFVGCNRFLVHGSECGATASDSTKGPPVETLDAIDDDCDGVTLQVADSDGIFVSASMGLDSNPGTQAAPVATISKALQILGGKRAVFVSADTYVNAISLTPGTSNRQLYFYGGFTGAAWTQGGASSELKPGVTAVRVDGLSVGGNDAPKSTVLFDHFKFNPVGADAVETHFTQLVLRACSAMAVSDISAPRGVWLRDRSRLTMTDGDFESSGTTLEMAPSTRADVTNSVLRNPQTPLTVPTNAGAVGVDGATLNAAGTQMLGGPALGTSSGLSVGGSATVTLSSSSSQRTVVVAGGGGNFSFGVYQTGGSLAATAAEIRGGASNNSAAIWQEGGGSLRVLSSVLRAAVSTDSNPDSVVRIESPLQQVFINNFIDATKANQTAFKSVHGMTVLNNSGGTLLTNNAFISTGSMGVALLVPNSGAGRVTLHNNAFQAQACLIDSNGCQQLNNCAAWASRCQEELMSINQDCDFDSSDHLNQSSACNGAGADGLADNGNVAFTDLDGQARPISDWDIGPDER